METENKIFFECSESTFMYFQNPFVKLNLKDFEIDIVENVDFEIFISYSYDKINYSEFILFSERKNKIIDEYFGLYVCVWFKRIIKTDLETPISLYDIKPSEDKYYGNSAYLKNVDETKAYISILNIKYDDIFLDIDLVKFKEKFELVDEFPRWNFYDNQMVNVYRWLSTINATSEMYGHTCIYFKTEPVEFEDENPQSGIHGTHFQLSNNVIRNVVEVKKLHILFPNNEMPQDRTIFTEWDMPLQDDVVIHVVRQKFEQAFGLKTIPNEKDYLYFPLINKMFRVTTMQPKTGFMGVCGWYEVYLMKYEDDDCVHISKELKEEMFDSNILNQFENIVEDGFIFENNIDEKIVEEQKEVTQNYTNKLEDNTFHVSLKETEKLREFYDKRLNIVTVNPDDNLFPISMYDPSTISKRTIALQYNLKEYTTKNKFDNLLSESFDLSFNYVMVKRFSGELIDIISENNVIFSLQSLNTKKLEIFETTTQQKFLIDFIFTENELYQININFNKYIGQYSIMIFRLNNRQKSLEYQNIYKVNKNISDKIITNIQLFGGSYLINDIKFDINKNQILNDECLPLLNMYKF